MGKTRPGVLVRPFAVYEWDPYTRIGETLWGCWNIIQGGSEMDNIIQNGDGLDNFIRNEAQMDNIIQNGADLDNIIRQSLFLDNDW